MVREIGSKERIGSGRFEKRGDAKEALGLRKRKGGCCIVWSCVLFCVVWFCLVLCSLVCFGLLCFGVLVGLFFVG